MKRLKVRKRELDQRMARLVVPALFAAAAAPALVMGLGFRVERVAVAAPKAPVTDAPQVGTLVPLMDPGVKWGMTHLEVVDAYNRAGGIYDREYDATLRRLQPGVQQKAVESERDGRKLAFTRSFIEFKENPTGYDTTPLKGEYTYRNHESIMQADIGGKRRYLFFIGAQPEEKLWKIYDEVPLAEGGIAGKTFQDAVTKYQTRVGGAGRVRPADAEKGVFFASADWQDANTHLRLLDRSQQSPHVVGVVLEDRRVLGNLANLRRNQPEDPLAIDPAIGQITRGGISDPNAQAPKQPAPPQGKPAKP